MNYLESCAPKGHVVIKDVTNNRVLVDDHNLIVSGGRNILANIFLKEVARKSLLNNEGSEDPICNDTASRSYKLKSIVFGSNNKEVEISDTSIASFGENVLTFSLDKKNTETKEADPVKISYSARDLVEGVYIPSIVFTISFTGIEILQDPTEETITHTAVISELGIYMEESINDASTSDILFSRIRFDSLALTAATEYQLTYTIYF